jgi:hypothetical protein
MGAELRYGILVGGVCVQLAPRFWGSVWVNLFLLG